MARLAECLIPVISALMTEQTNEYNQELSAKLTDEDDQEALDEEKQNAIIALLEPLLIQFSQNINQDYYKMMGQKLGIAKVNESDNNLTNDLLALMQRDGLDYTRTFVDLGTKLSAKLSELSSSDAAELAQADDEIDEWQAWLNRWYARVSGNVDDAKALMEKTNPVVIPRNHHVEAILATSEETGDLTELHKFLSVLRQPYVVLDQTKNYQDSPADGGVNYHTFCGT
jgi:uncharacterized protein YdiU (UPF0061 family)